MGVGSSGGGGGFSETACAAEFFAGRVEEAIAEADANNAFYKLFRATAKTESFSTDHATLADALAVTADRAAIYTDLNWATYGWKSEAIRTYIKETAPQPIPAGYAYAVVTGVSTSGMRDLMVAHDGSAIFYRIGGSGTTLYKRTMSTAYDISTLSGSTTSVNLSTAGFSGIGTTYGWHFANNGSLLIHPNGTALEYCTLSTPYDLTTLSSVSTVALPSGSAEYQAWINHDGSKIYFYSANNTASTVSGLDGAIEGTFGTNYDMTTITWDAEEVYLMPSASTATGKTAGFADNGNVFWYYQPTGFKAQYLNTAGDLGAGSDRELEAPFPSTSTSTWSPANNATTFDSFFITPNGDHMYFTVDDFIYWVDLSNFDWNTDVMYGANGVQPTLYADQIVDIPDPDGILTSHNAYGMQFSPDGLRVYLSWHRSSYTGHVQVLKLTTPYDLTTLEHIAYLQGTPNSTNGFFHQDGLGYTDTINGSGSTVRHIRYLNHPDMIETDQELAVLTRTMAGMNISWSASYEPAFYWKPDGTKWFIVSNDGTNWDLTESITIDGPVFEFENWLNNAGRKNQYLSIDTLKDGMAGHANQNTNGIWFSEDGDYMIVYGQNDAHGTAFSLGTPWDSSTLADWKMHFVVGAGNKGWQAHFMPSHARFHFAQESKKLYRFHIPTTTYSKALI
jgi:hypothetical protein